jgi:hypothetical protein
VTAQRVIVLIGADADPTVALNSGGGIPTDQRDGSTVTVIALRAPTGNEPYSFHTITSGTSLVDKISHALGLAALGQVLQNSSPGRLINSLNPLDQSRVFSRAVRRDPKATQLIAGATLVVAVDMPAVRAAWFARHSGAVPRAVFTLAAAREVLAAG